MIRGMPQPVPAARAATGSDPSPISDDGRCRRSAGRAEFRIGVRSRSTATWLRPRPGPPAPGRAIRGTMPVGLGQPEPGQAGRAAAPSPGGGSGAGPRLTASPPLPPTKESPFRAMSH
jgi:hypothetical protein